jgi:SAM-dependent MidA family methyltransferase
VKELKKNEKISRFNKFEIKKNSIFVVVVINNGLFSCLSIHIYTHNNQKCKFEI